VKHGARTAAAAALLALAAGCATAPSVQVASYSAEIAKIETTEKRVTLKASMGEQTMQVAPSVALQAFKVGDKVLITFGQDGTEPVITRIELRQP
jgi:Cu/Ag efflux protein CusF